MSTLTQFIDKTAARDMPDRAVRWFAYWDTYSDAIPDEMTEAEYSNVTFDAWSKFKKQEETDEVERLATAWGIRQFKQLPRFVPHRERPQPTATVVPSKRWEPCAYWRGEVCTVHQHAVSNTSLAQAQDMFSHFQFFVRKHLGAALMAYTDGKAYEKFTDVEQEVWWAVVARMMTYRPLQNEKGEDMPQAWLKSIVRSVVSDHFKGKHRQKCDVRKEVQFFDNAANRGISNPDDPPPAHPTPTANALNGIRDENDEK